MEVRAHVLKDLKFQGYPAYRFSDYLNDPRFYGNYLSITCVLYHPGRKLVYCGLTAYNHDLLYTFDPAAKRFQSCGFAAVTEKYEVKIHHSLELDTDGTIYCATACLHDLDEYLNAPGGSLYHYFPDTGKIEKLAVPVPHNYIQMINYDRKRGLLYGATYPEAKIFRFDIASRRSQVLGLINCFPEHLAIDDTGGFWGSWLGMNGKDMRLFRYDPDRNMTEYLLPGIPTTSVVSSHYGKKYDTEIDKMLNGEDGFLYVGTELGMFFRLDPRTRKIEYLGKPCVAERLPGLTLGDDGLIYGCGGDNGLVELFTYERATGRIRNLGVVRDDDTGEFCFRPHGICVTDNGTVYVAETDTPTRSAYLWEIQTK